MIKKSKKCLALSLFLANLVPFMGSFNIHAMDGGCARPERLASSLVGKMLPTGLTSEDLILKPIQDAESVYRDLKGEIHHIYGEPKPIPKPIGPHGSFFKILISSYIEHTLKTKTGNSRMIANRFIYEFLKICHESVDIYPLCVCFEGGDVHYAVVLIAEGRCYVIDLAYDLKNEISDCEPFIFTAREYMRFMNSKNSNIRFRALQINFKSSLDPRKWMIIGYKDLGDICDKPDLLNLPHSVTEKYQIPARGKVL